MPRGFSVFDRNKTYFTSRVSSCPHVIYHKHNTYALTSTNDVLGQRSVSCVSCGRAHVRLKNSRRSNLKSRRVGKRKRVVRSTANTGENVGRYRNRVLHATGGARCGWANKSPVLCDFRGHSAVANTDDPAVAPYELLSQKRFVSVTFWYSATCCYDRKLSISSRVEIFDLAIITQTEYCSNRNIPWVCQTMSACRCFLLSKPIACVQRG